VILDSMLPDTRKEANLIRVCRSAAYSDDKCRYCNYLAANSFSELLPIR
jgi:hypothetical protein